jgi:autotransporter-associated beta strand protein
MGSATQAPASALFFDWVGSNITVTIPIIWRRDATIQNSTTLTKAYTFNAAQTFEGATGSVTVTLSCTTTMSGQINFNTSTTLNTISNMTLTGPIAGTGALTKTGAGILSLDNQDNTALTGPIVINGGQFEANINAVSSANVANPGTESGIAGASSLSVLSGLAYIGNANLTVAYPISISSGATVYAGGFNQTGTYLQDITGEITGAGTLALWTFGSNFNRPVINRVRSSTLPATLRMMTYAGVGDYRPVYYYYSGSGNPNTVDLIVDLNQTTSMEQPTTTMYVHNVSPTAGVLTFRDVIKSASNAEGIPDLVTLNIGVVGAASGVTDTGDIVITRDVYQASGNGALSITKAGSRKLTLAGATGATRYSGATSIQAGIWAARSAGGLGAAVSNGVSVSGTGQLEIGGGVTVEKGSTAFTLAPNTMLVPDGINRLETAAVALSGVVPVNVSANAKLTLANGGAISGLSAGFNKQGDGELELVAFANTYTGNVTVSAGTLTLGSVGAAASWGSGAGAVSVSGTLKYVGVGHTTTRSLTLTGAAPSLDASGTGAVEYANATQTSEARTITLTGTSAHNNIASFNIGDTSAVTALTKSGPGKWTTSGTLSYTGATTISGGTLNLGATNRTLTTVAISGGVLATNSGATVAANVTMTGGLITAELAGTSKTLDVDSGVAKLYPVSGGNTFSGTTTVDAGATLDLLTDTLPGSASTAGRVLGTSNVTLNGQLRTRGGTTQKGQVRYGGNLTFNAGSSLYIGAAP